MEQQLSEENKGTSPISDNKKRPRVDNSDDHSPESKLARLDSADSVLSPSQIDADSAERGFYSDNSGAEAKRIQDELLSVLENSDEPPIQGLDSVIKSFEEEILPAKAEMTSFTGEAQPDLGYLLEASDDELGLPPTFSTENNQAAEENAGISGNPGGLGDLYGEFENELPVGYDSFELGLEDGNKSYNEGEGFVTLGGLFDYSDESFGSGDISGLQWQAESLSAL